MSLVRLIKAHKIQHILILSLVFGVCFNVKSEARPERLLLATQEWRPYQYQEDGQMKGPGIDKLKCIMKVMEQPYQLTMTDWDRAQLLVEVGEQHGFFLASPNRLRDKYADYSSPVMNQVWSWFSLSESIDPEKEMFKEEVAVTALFGSNKWLWLHKAGYRVEKKPRQPIALVELLLAGEIGAVLSNDFVMQEAIKSLGISHRFITRRVMKEKPLGVYFSKEFIKLYPQFMREFNQAIAQCKER